MVLVALRLRGQGFKSIRLDLGANSCDETGYGRALIHSQQACAKPQCCAAGSLS